MRAYDQSTRAAMIFDLELDRHDKAVVRRITSDASPLGIMATNLLAAHHEVGRDSETLMGRVIRRLSRPGVQAQRYEILRTLIVSSPGTRGEHVCGLTGQHDREPG